MNKVNSLAKNGPYQSCKASSLSERLIIYNLNCKITVLKHQTKIMKKKEEETEADKEVILKKVGFVFNSYIIDMEETSYCMQILTNKIV